MQIYDENSLNRSVMYLDIAQHLLSAVDSDLYFATALCNLEQSVVCLANAGLTKGPKFESYAKALRFLPENDSFRDLREYGSSISDWYVRLHDILPQRDVKFAVRTVALTIIESMRSEVRVGGIFERLNIIEDSLRIP